MSNKMTARAKELYFHTINAFEKEIKKISPTCASPIIAIRQVVKQAIEKYNKDYCTNNESPFTEEDYKLACNAILADIMHDAVRSVYSLTQYEEAIIAKHLAAFNSNFKEIIIQKIKRRYYIYQEEPNHLNPNWIYVADNIDHLNGWLYGAVQAKRKRIIEKDM